MGKKIYLMVIVFILILFCSACPEQQEQQEPKKQAQAAECWKRAGPYATQDTAWRRWRESQGQGSKVSNGVFPCYDQYGIRGYCFNVFFPCPQ